MFGLVIRFKWSFLCCCRILFYVLFLSILCSILLLPRLEIVGAEKAKALK